MQKGAIRLNHLSKMVFTLEPPIKGGIYINGGIYIKLPKGRFLI